MKECLNPPSLPIPGGHYSQVVRAGNLVFLAGMVPMGPDKVVAGTDIRSQTRRCLENMRDAVAFAGGSLADVCTVTAYLVDEPRDFEGYNEVYGEFFPSGKPARATVQAGLDNILVEIQAIAVGPD